MRGSVSLPPAQICLTRDRRDGAPAHCLRLIALGIGTILRHSDATIATGVGLLFLPVLFLGAFPERIAKRIEQFTPLAGMAVQSTTDRMLSPFDGRTGMPIGPWQGLGVAFAWALGALVVGYVGCASATSDRVDRGPVM